MKSGAFAEYKIFTGNSHPKLAEEIASIMGKPLGKLSVNTFSDGEISVDLWETVRGVDRVVSMDLHASQIQGYFDIPVDHLLGTPILVKYFKQKNLENLVVVSPDHGSVTRARNMAQPLHAPIAIVDKRRPEPNKSEIMNIIGDIEGKTCLLVDDMIDTAGTITNAANALKDMGAIEVYACATHPILSGPAIERIQSSAIKELVLLNTAPVPDEKMIDKMTLLSVAPLFAEAMMRIFTNDSISKLFD